METNLNLKHVYITNSCYKTPIWNIYLMFSSISRIRLHPCMPPLSMVQHSLSNTVITYSRRSDKHFFCHIPTFQAAGPSAFRWSTNEKKMLNTGAGQPFCFHQHAGDMSSWSIVMCYIVTTVVIKAGRTDWIKANSLTDVLHSYSLCRHPQWRPWRGQVIEAKTWWRRGTLHYTDSTDSR